MENTTAKSFSVGDTLSEAWNLLRGIKWSYWATMLVILALCAVVGTTYALYHNDKINIWFFIVSAVVAGIIAVSLMGGLIMICIKRARGEAVSAKTGFQYFNRFFPVFFTFTLVMILSSVIVFVQHMTGITGVIILLIRWVYVIFLIAFIYFAIPFAADRINNPFKALARSFKITKPIYFKMLALIIVIYLIEMVMFAPLLLPTVIKQLHQFPIFALLGLITSSILSIWLLPYLTLIQGVAYHKLCD